MLDTLSRLVKWVRGQAGGDESAAWNVLGLLVQWVQLISRRLPFGPQT